MLYFFILTVFHIFVCHLRIIPVCDARRVSHLTWSAVSRHTVESKGAMINPSLNPLIHSSDTYWGNFSLTHYSCTPVRLERADCRQSSSSLHPKLQEASYSRNLPAPVTWQPPASAPAPTGERSGASNNINVHGNPQTANSAPLPTAWWFPFHTLLSQGAIF